VAQVDENRTMQYGILASDIATNLFDSFRRIMQFNAGTLPTGAGAYAPAGAFSEPLADNQRQFLQAEVAGIKQAIDTLRDAEAQNGVRMDQLDKVRSRQEGDLVFWRGFISEIEDVNLTEVIANLNANQTALEASTQIVARLSRVSLLDFI
jgi:flagellar hook-associated protein 3 FlgL